MKVKGITPKVYEQSIGFLRIVDGTNPLDKTSVHPESYDKVEKLLDYLQLSLNDLGSEKLITALDNINEDEIIKKLEIDKYTLDDIISSLKQPERDLRDKYPQPLLRSPILHI